MIPDPAHPINRTTLPAVGEPAPWFHGRCTTNPQFCFDTVAGRYVVLCFYATAGDATGQHVIHEFVANRDRFDDNNACFFGISIDPLDEQLDRVRELLPGIRYFWDFDHKISRLYGAIVRQELAPPAAVVSRRCTLVLDERLRVLAAFHIDADPNTHVSRVLDFLGTLPALAAPRVAPVQAPILVVPNVFEPELCRQLMDYYDVHGGRDSGFMRDVNGKTASMIDYGHKRRRDCDISDESLRRACMVRIHDRLAPEILRAYQFHATRMERYIVGCYDATESGHFRAHRDNTTLGTAHRRFAVSLHLNTGEYEGGYLRFPEFGRQLYVAPVGGAVVFSCSLLHEATPVTRGRRYVFLPFLYDDEAAQIREQNRCFLTNGTSPLPDLRS